MLDCHGETLNHAFANPEAAMRSYKLRSYKLRLQTIREAATWLGLPHRPPPKPLKWRTIRRYAREYGLRTLVETGTYRGETVAALRPLFDQVITIELDDALHAAAARRFANDAGIDVLHGDSGELLPEVLERLDEPALFWLDGHWSGGVTARAGEDTPLRRELRALFTDSQPHVVLIDDAREAGRGDYPSISEVASLAAEHRYRCEVAIDILRVTPI